MRDSFSFRGSIPQELVKPQHTFVLWLQRRVIFNLQPATVVLVPATWLVLLVSDSS